MPDKKQLEAMAKKPNPENQKYDEDAEYAYYDEQLRKALEAKNPAKFKQYTQTISGKRQENLERMNALLALKKAGADLPATKLAEMWQEGKMPTPPSDYTEGLTEQDIRAVLGNDQYNRFMQLRRLPRFSSVNGISLRGEQDLARYSPIDLAIPKVVGNLSTGYEGKYTPPASFGVKAMQK